MPMKALILVGGFGTRLRPLTFTKPKPLVEFCNMAIVLHQIEALVQVGVDEVVLAVNYKPEAMMKALEGMVAKYDIKVTCSQETTPLGTAGPLALAREHLDDHTNSPFFVFNSDVICRYPLKALLQFHMNHGKEGTILVTRVEDPSKYGVVVSDEAGKIERFVEKPKKFVGDQINAGMYIFNPTILNRITLKPTSIEREIFPVMAAADELYSMVLPGYWMDIGQPKDYLAGMVSHIDSLAGDARATAMTGRGRARSRAGTDASAVSIEQVAVVESAGAGAGEGAGEDEAKEMQVSGNLCIVHPTATVAEDAVLGPHVVVGPGCVVESGARIERSCLLANSTVKKCAYVKSSIVGWGSTVGRWARTENVTVLGENVNVRDTVALNGVRVLPHKDIKASEYKEGTIIM